MKILKITLQNINSLKSDTPIVIDFESEQFRDIGLYAITGSTGAGKTTILDAITIALYHRVPRFNASHIKANLENVISYGATEAFTQVVFQNNEQRYEAHWSMRLVTKGGKIMSTPDEQVRIKNLTTGKILGDKKREVISEVERVTQLDYNQFLRSVMLAQGEFASFLSAKGTEKAKLLEQITGEEIYKKIGEVILKKRSEELAKLNEIKTKINNEDLLSNEQLTELRNESKQITTALVRLETSIKATESILLWYQQMSKLDQQTAHLNTEQSALLERKEKHGEDLEALQRSELAEPFREALQENERLEEDLIKQKQELLEIETMLSALIPKLAATQQTFEKNKVLLESAEKTVQDWLPMLEEVTAMDTSIENQTTNKQKQQQILQSIIEKLDELQQTETHILRSQKDKQDELAEVTKYLADHKHVPAIGAQFTTWNTDLTKLKVARQNWATLTDDCYRKKGALEASRKAYTADHQKFELEKAELTLAERALSLLLERSESQNLDKLITNKEEWINQRHSWVKMEEFSVRFLDVEKEKLELLQAKKENEATILKRIAKQEQLEKDIILANQGVEDAEKIVLLETQIKAFSEERKKLEQGKPCHLCGSTEHPYVSHYQDKETTDGNQEWIKRKKNLENLRMTHAENDKQVIASKTIATNHEVRLLQIDSDQSKLLDQSKRLGLPCQLTELDEIQRQKRATDSDLKEIEDLIKKTQLLLQQKANQEESIALKKANLSQLEVALSTITERGKNLKDELAAKVQLQQKDEQSIKNMEADLSRLLAPYQMQVPTIDQTDTFIEQIKNDIAAYTDQTNKSTAIKADLEVIETKLGQNNKELTQKTSEHQEIQQVLDDLSTTIDALVAKRTAILPQEIMVKTKRENLALAVEKAKQAHENTEKVLAEWQLQKEQLTTEKTLKVKLIEKSETDLKKVISKLEEQIEASAFGDIEAVRSAVLSYEDKQELVELKEQINNRAVELNTLSIQYQNEKAALETQRNFEITSLEAQSEQSQQQETKDTLLQRSGEITEQMASNDRIMQRNKGVLREINTQEKVYQKWADLLTLLGGSQDAFNTYVQRLTLTNLIGFANIHLYKLNKRYALMMEDTYKKGEELNFKLIDHYQTDQTRLVDTTSGGEKFLISLSLALGLSDLASNHVNIDSLFIDEGFGTLDNHTLETVISTLETLQAQGKMIGIISHVENLKERIPTQIQVSKRSNGVSVVEVV